MALPDANCIISPNKRLSPERLGYSKGFGIEFFEQSYWLMRKLNLKIMVSLTLPTIDW